ncbi:MAG TPA: porin [Vicinamibacteria bacterium]|nr:porin [Vicinamibacteria bacterium]
MTLPAALVLALAASPSPSAPGAAPPARELRLGGLLQAWGTLALQDGLRVGTLDVPPNRYYGLRSEFTEDGLSLRRAEVKLTGHVHPKVDFTLMADLTLGSGLLQDLVIAVRPTPRLLLRAGQFKSLQTLEGLAGSGDLLFPERGQATRAFGDVRDRGAAASWTFGTSDGWLVTPSVAVFNGSGKSNDVNRAKDVAGRVEVRRGPRHLAGIYGLAGRSDVPSHDRGALTFAGADAPDAADILRADDRTTNLGAFYAWQGGAWQGSVEWVRGRLGRRFPTLGLAAGPARREHLEQLYQGAMVTAAWTRHRLTLAARYDVLDFNLGNRSYDASDPYPSRDSVPAVDYTPYFEEATVGGRLAIDEKNPATANLRLAYVHRRGHFLRLADGSRPHGGDSLVAALQVAF